MTEGGERDGSTDTADSVAEERFRGETRRFLEAALPRKGEASRSDASGVERARVYQRQLAAAGLAGLTWPVEYGGRGLPHRFQRIFDQEAAPPFFDGEEIRYRAPVCPGWDLSARNADGTLSVPIHILPLASTASAGTQLLGGVSGSLRLWM